MAAPKLPPHEWVIVSLLIITISLLAVVTLTGKKERLPATTKSIDLMSDVIQVTLQGAVAHPGVYELKKGSKLKDLLLIGSPLEEAHLLGLKVNSKLRDGQTVKIPAQEWITVHLEGAVETKESLKVRKGTLLKDLIDQVAFLPEADILKLNKKRRLKDQEVIDVPVRKQIQRKVVQRSLKGRNGLRTSDKIDKMDAID